MTGLTPECQRCRHETVLSRGMILGDPDGLRARHESVLSHDRRPEI